MRRAIFAAILLIAGAAAAAEISDYEVFLKVVDARSATGTARISVADAAAGEMTIPLGFEATNVRATAAPAGTTLRVEPLGRQTRLHITFPSAAPAVPIELSFAAAGVLYLPEPPAGQQHVLPRGAWMLGHVLVATEPVTIRHYRCDVIFPQTLRAHAVRAALPKTGKKEAEPRVALASIDGAPGVRLRTGRLVQGDTAAMQVELVPQSHSPLWIVSGVLLSIAYLIRFRSVVFGDAKAPASAQDGQDHEERQ